MICPFIYRTKNLSRTAKIHEANISKLQPQPRKQRWSAMAFSPCRPLKVSIIRCEFLVAPKMPTSPHQWLHWSLVLCHGFLETIHNKQTKTTFGYGFFFAQLFQPLIFFKRKWTSFTWVSSRVSIRKYRLQCYTNPSKWSSWNFQIFPVESCHVTLLWSLIHRWWSPSNWSSTVVLLYFGSTPPPPRMQSWQMNFYRD